MYKITNKQILAKDIKRLDVRAPDIVKHVQAGQFVMVTVEEGARSIPLAVVESDTRRGTIALIIQETGSVTSKLAAMSINEEIYAVLGPLGQPSQIEKSGVVLCVATGIWAAQILPICRALKEQGNKVIGVVGAKTKSSLMLEAQMRIACHKIFISTDDGSYERRGMATDVVREVLETEDVQKVYAAGSVEMMQAVCQITKRRKISTRVQVNPGMCCGTGQCGSCRIEIKKQEVLVCQQGPEFDGHKVDFETVSVRIGAFENKKDEAKYDLTAPTPLESLSRFLKTTKKDSDESLEGAGKAPRDFNESKGLSRRDSSEKARSCPQCTSPVCMQGCPLGIDIPGFIRSLREGDTNTALERIKKQNPFPAICGRVCAAPCEASCILAEEGKAIKIRALERYAADCGKQRTLLRSVQKRTGKKVAIVGSGPAGLTAAVELAEKNYRVTVFEAMPVAGGALRYGVPEFRMPAKILDAQIDMVGQLGIEVLTNCSIGKTITVEELKKQGFEAVLFCVGGRGPHINDLSGRYLGGVYYAGELLMQVNLMDLNIFRKQTHLRLGKEIVVVGSGNIALDCARSCVRLGRKVKVVFPETEEEIDGHIEEREQAKKEGVEFEGLVHVQELVGGEDGFVSGLNCMRMDFADPKGIGVWQLLLVPDSDFQMAADTVIWAEEDDRDTLVEEDADFSGPDFFTAGDMTAGGGNVAMAMATGKKAAQEIHQYLG
ncbi:MAG: sulfide/dihydroorotate dehydrogenase-like FAD/NAD-binding protein [Candidatus Omnitrophica bacterium]|nr:sulfide/dihydroorotate dehydrogenase-like FAD/NAD-binding protein [Candidatus Omnitrophota bacterium]